MNDLIRSKWWIGLLGFGIYALAVFGLGSVLSQGFDHHDVWYPTARNWLSGRSQLYDALSRGYYNPPWGVFLFLPFVWLPPDFSSAAMNVLSLLAVIYGIHLYWRDQLTPILLVFCLFTWAMAAIIMPTQLDGYIFFGIVLAIGAIRDRRPWLLSAALALLSIKAINLFLLVPIFFWSIRRWSWEALAKVVSIPVLLFVTSFPIFGFDWPQRFLESYGTQEPFNFNQITIWHFADYYQAPSWPLTLVSIGAVAAVLWLVWREDRLSDDVIAAVLATTILISPYIIAHHYILLIPAVLFIATRDLRFGILIYILNFMPPIRFVMGWPAVTDLLYPIAVWGTVWGLIIFGRFAPAEGGDSDASSA